LRELRKDSKLRNLSHAELRNIENLRNNAIINLWLKYNKDSSIVAQDCTPCTENSEKELFKYFTKILVKTGGQYRFFPEQYDTIFQSMYKKRTFRTYGIKKQVSEDIEDIQSVEIEELEQKFAIYSFEGWDWYDIESGEALTNYEPPDTLVKLVDSIKNVDLAKEKEEPPPDYQQIILERTLQQRENDFYND